MHNFMVHGYASTGTYTCKCECGATWTGTTRVFHTTHYDPALPVAECVVHWRLEHVNKPIHISWSPSFTAWLIEYWEATNELLIALHDGSSRCQM